jgi:hypothetical protein
VQTPAALLAGIFAVILLTSCAGKKQPQRFAATSLAPASSRVSSSKARINAATVKSVRVEGALVRAEATTNELIRITPPDLRPLVDSLKSDITFAKGENLLLRKELDAAQIDTGHALIELSTAQARIEEETVKANLSEQRRVDAETKVAYWREKTMDWRAWFSGAVTLFLSALAFHFFGWRAALVPCVLGSLVTAWLKLI